jgi:TolB-like protein
MGDLQVQLDILSDQRTALLDGAELSLGARAFDVLAYLHAHADRVVAKAELLDHVWSGMIVEEGNLSVQIAGLRKALGKEAIKTVPGVGYRLTLGARAEPAQDPGPDVPEIPSLAVLPFANLTGAEGRDFLVDGIVTEIIAALSRVSGFFVISSTSSFTYKGRAVDLAQVGRELGVRYVVEGSIQQAGDRLRIFTQLVEAVSGHTIWQNRFDGQVSEIFDLQDQIAEEVAGALEPKLIWAEAARTRTKPTDSLSAYESVLACGAAGLAAWTRGPIWTKACASCGKPCSATRVTCRPRRTTASPIPGPSRRAAGPSSRRKAALDTALGGRERGA